MQQLAYDEYIDWCSICSITVVSQFKSTYTRLDAKVFHQCIVSLSYSMFWVVKPVECLEQSQRLWSIAIIAAVNSFQLAQAIVALLCEGKSEEKSWQWEMRAGSALPMLQEWLDRQEHDPQLHSQIQIPRWWYGAMLHEISTRCSGVKVARNCWKWACQPESKGVRGFSLECLHVSWAWATVLHFCRPSTSTSTAGRYDICSRMHRTVLKLSGWAPIAVNAFQSSAARTESVTASTTVLTIVTLSSNENVYVNLSWLLRRSWSGHCCSMLKVELLEVNVTHLMKMDGRPCKACFLYMSAGSIGLADQMMAFYRFGFVWITFAGRKIFLCWCLFLLFASGSQWVKQAPTHLPEIH